MTKEGESARELRLLLFGEGSYRSFRWICNEGTVHLIRMAVIPRMDIVYTVGFYILLPLCHKPAGPILNVSKLSGDQISGYSVS